MIKRNKLILIGILVTLILALIPSIAFAQDGGDPPPDGEITDDDVNEIAKTLYCPVCENVPLDVCGTQACADWRAEIRTMLQDGRSVEEIQTYFEERYGRRVLATPDARGIDIVVWVLPPLGVLAGIAFLVVVLRRMAPGALEAQGSLSSADVAYEDLDPDYVARLEQDVQEFASST